MKKSFKYILAIGIIKKAVLFIFLFSNFSFSQEVDRLISYTKNKDDFKYNIIDTLRYEGATLFRIMMQSGKWLTKNEVDEPFWKHWVDIVVPDTLDTNTALLFIGGGTKNENQIYLDSTSIKKAIQTHSVISHVSNIPYQPISFKKSDSIERYEDDLIAYGWNHFLEKGGIPENAEWLARFPMTRASVRAMDVVEEVTKSENFPVKSFFVSGASKRGWTTWTTAAVDKRVIGIAPLVIDLLNIIPSFDHHYRVYGDWSPAVQEYVNFNIMDWMGKPAFKKLLNHVEPFEFKELLTLPKLIVNGTIDEFFVTDSWKFYWDALPGRKYLQYVPNGNHGLTGSYQNQNIFSFYDRLIHDQPIPKMEWNIKKNKFNLDIDNKIPHEINLWKINNPKARDFRIWEVGRNWKKTSIPKNSTGRYEITAPDNLGFTASLVEVIFYPNSDNPLVLTTGTVVLPDTYPFESYEPRGN